MVNTGDWGIEQLVKYLISIADMLSSQEIEWLQRAAVFPQEGMSTRRRIPGKLYEPTESLRLLGLPLLSWNGSCIWLPDSPEGM